MRRKVRRVKNWSSKLTCYLFIEKANARRTGNWSRFRANGINLGIIWILGMYTFSPRYLPFKMVVSIKIDCYLLTASREPVQRRGRLMCLNKIITEPTFKRKLCRYGNSNEFTNSDNIIFISENVTWFQHSSKNWAPVILRRIFDCSSRTTFLITPYHEYNGQILMKI